MTSKGTRPSFGNSLNRLLTLSSLPSLEVLNSWKYFHTSEYFDNLLITWHGTRGNFRRFPILYVGAHGIKIMKLYERNTRKRSGIDEDRGSTTVSEIDASY